MRKRNNPGDADKLRKNKQIARKPLAVQDLFDFLFNITSYVIDNDITLKDGETIELTAEQKISIKLSKARFVEGTSIKLEI